MPHKRGSKSKSYKLRALRLKFDSKLSEKDYEYRIIYGRLKVKIYEN